MLSIELSKKIQSYVDKNKCLPSKVIVNNVEYSYPVAGYFILKNVVNIKENVKKISVSKPPNGTGDIINITIEKEKYISLAKTLVKFVEKNKRLPNYLEYNNKKISPRAFIYAYAKILVFYNTEKRLPKTCLFTSSVFGSNGTNVSVSKTKGGTVCKALAKASGVTITDYKTLYKAFYYAVYLYYKNDCFSQSVALKRFAQKLGMNCADLGQLAYVALKELKYNVKIVRGVIKCNSGSFGHIWCRVTVDGKTLNFDASAAAKRKTLGNMICGKIVEITDYNPSWAVSDDGRT